MCGEWLLLGLGWVWLGWLGTTPETDGKTDCETDTVKKKDLQPLSDA
jgi:hypothetical protein